MKVHCRETGLKMVGSERSQGIRVIDTAGEDPARLYVFHAPGVNAYTLRRETGALMEGWWLWRDE
jgi:hypothetical protein